MISVHLFFFFILIGRYSAAEIIKGGTCDVYFLLNSGFRLEMVREVYSSRVVLMIFALEVSLGCLVSAGTIGSRVTQ